MPFSQQSLHAMLSLLVQTCWMGHLSSKQIALTRLMQLHLTADRCRRVNSLGDSVEQVSPDNVFSGVLLERNDSQIYQEGNRSHLQQFCLGDLRAVAQH